MMELKTLSTVKKSAAGEVRISEDVAGKNKNRYTVLVIDDHSVVHALLSAYDKAEHIEEPTYIDMFSDEGRFFLVFPYIPPRPLDKFYMGEVMSLRQCEEVCVNLIIACMTANLPWQFLYMILEQREIQLANDRSVTLSFCVDFSEFDPAIDESDCVQACAKILIDLLTPKADRRANSYVLLTKKIEKDTYNHFTELYKDVKAAMQPIRRGGILLRLKVWFMRNKDTLFAILLRVSVILAVFVLLTFLTNLIFGDVPWLRLFIRSFERIGLEDLTQ